MDVLNVFLRSKVVRLPGESTSLRKLHSAFCEMLLPNELPKWPRKAFADALRSRGFPVGLDYDGREVVGNLRLVKRKQLVELGGYLRPIAA